MARKLRVQYPGAVYHVMNRGDRREPIFQESALAKAQRIAQEELSALGWTAQDLRGRWQSDPQKVRIAARLRRETTMTLEWIADRLCMGAATHVACLLQRYVQKVSNSEETLF